MSEKEAREQILSMVSEYCDKYHNQEKPLKKDREFLMLLVFMTMKKW